MHYCRDDPGLLGAEMWANRTLTHAADARRYGVEGLIGIHWRTFETSLSLKALTRVAWEPDLTAERMYTDFAVAALDDVDRGGANSPLWHPSDSTGSSMKSPPKVSRQNYRT